MILAFPADVLIPAIEHHCNATIRNIHWTLVFSEELDDMIALKFSHVKHVSESCHKFGLLLLVDLVEDNILVVCLPPEHALEGIPVAVHQSMQVRGKPVHRILVLLLQD